MDYLSILQFLYINAAMHIAIDKIMRSPAIPDYDKGKWVYDYVFSDHCSSAALKLHRFDWLDLDTSYEEDSYSFISAFDEECEKVRTLL